MPSLAFILKKKHCSKETILQFFKTKQISLKSHWYNEDELSVAELEQKVLDLQIITQSDICPFAEFL